MYNYAIFYRQLDFSSHHGVVIKIWENKAESCLTVASYSFIVDFYTRFSENWPIRDQSDAWQLLRSCLYF